MFNLFLVGVLIFCVSSKSKKILNIDGFIKQGGHTGMQCEICLVYYSFKTKTLTSIIKSKFITEELIKNVFEKAKGYCIQSYPDNAEQVSIITYSVHSIF